MAIFEFPKQHTSWHGLTLRVTNAVEIASVQYSAGDYLVLSNVGGYLRDFGTRPLANDDGSYCLSGPNYTSNGSKDVADDLITACQEGDITSPVPWATLFLGSGHRMLDGTVLPEDVASWDGVEMTSAEENNLVSVPYPSGSLVHFVVKNNVLMDVGSVNTRGIFCSGDPYSSVGYIAPDFLHAIRRAEFSQPEGSESWKAWAANPKAAKSAAFNPFKECSVVQPAATTDVRQQIFEICDRMQSIPDDHFKQYARIGLFFTHSDKFKTELRTLLGMSETMANDLIRVSRNAASIGNPNSYKPKANSSTTNINQKVIRGIIA